MYRHLILKFDQKKTENHFRTPLLVTRMNKTNIIHVTHVLSKELTVKIH